MVRLAITGRSAFVLDRIELERAGPSYAVDTVADIARQSRRDGRPEPWFILASEALHGFPAWREPERVLELSRIAVAPRPGNPAIDDRWVATHYPGREHRFAFLRGPLIDVAATRIRERVARGEPVDDMVPGMVLDYIEAHGLYRPSVGDAA